MDSLAQCLRAFRDSFYRCLDRHADALFELTDAILTAGSVPSPVHLSLATVHRRGRGSLYDALGMGRMDEEGLRGLLSRHPLGERDAGVPPIYAVDVSVWPRCDAEASPQRGYYPTPQGTPPGSPSLAGGPTSSSPSSASIATRGWRPWTPGGYDRRKTPTRSSPSRCGLWRNGYPSWEALPIFVFDAGYDPVKLQRALEGCPARILVRLHSNRVFNAAPEEVQPKLVGRPRRHGKRFDLKDPAS
jgi:hypothetical protein